MYRSVLCGFIHGFWSVGNRPPSGWSISATRRVSFRLSGGLQACLRGGSVPLRRIWTVFDRVSVQDAIQVSLNGSRKRHFSGGKRAGGALSGMYKAKSPRLKRFNCHTDRPRYKNAPEKSELQGVAKSLQGRHPRPNGAANGARRDRCVTAGAKARAAPRRYRSRHRRPPRGTRTRRARVRPPARRRQAPRTRRASSPSQRTPR